MIKKTKFKDFDAKEANAEHDSRVEKKKAIRKDIKEHNRQKMYDFFGTGTMTIQR